MRRFLICVMTALTCAMASVSAGTVAYADNDPVVAEYPAGSQPLQITTGPDGSVWYTQIYSNINRIDAAGNITTYSIPSPTSNSRAAVLGDLAVASRSTSQ